MWEKKGWRWKYAWILKQSRRITCSSSFTKMNVFPYIRWKETYKQQAGEEKRVFFAGAFFKAQLRNMYACAKHKIAFLRLACQKKVFSCSQGNLKESAVWPRVCRRTVVWFDVKKGPEINICELALILLQASFFCEAMILQSGYSLFCQLSRLFLKGAVRNPWDEKIPLI